MKTPKIHVAFFLLILPLFIGAQPITVTHVQTFIANGTNNALAVNIPDAQSQVVLEAWKKLMTKSGGELTGQTEVLARNAKISGISPDVMDVFAVCNQKEGFVEMLVAFKTGTGFIYPATSPVAYAEAEKMVKEFAVRQSTEALKKRLSGEEKELKQLVRKEKKLKKENRKLNKQIVKYQRKIERAQKGIESISQTMITLTPGIEAARVKVAETMKRLKEIR